MKYLIHIHPPQEFIQQIEEYRQNFGPQIQPQLNGYHITLMVSRFHSTEETSIIKDLEGICQTPFNVHADKMELFKKDTLVIKLSSEELKELHNKIIKSLAKYIDWANTEQYAGDPEREQVCKKYGSQFYAEFYQPHITVIEAEPAVFKQNLLNLNFFAGKTFRINEFYLSKKEKKWETVKKFQLTNPKSF